EDGIRDFHVTGVQTCALPISDFTLNNYDKYFTPHSTSPIEEYILPKRPVRLLQGFDGENLQQFVGLTQGMPEVDEMSATASFTEIGRASCRERVEIRMGEEAV